MQPTKRPRILSLIPPMTQLNVPYPATAYLTGFLRDRGYPARQADLAIQLVLDLLSPSGLETLREAAEALRGGRNQPGPHDGQPPTLTAYADLEMGAAHGGLDLSPRQR